SCRPHRITSVVALPNRATSVTTPPHRVIPVAARSEAEGGRPGPIPEWIPARRSLRSLGRDDGHLAPLPHPTTPVATLPHRVIPVAARSEAKGGRPGPIPEWIPAQRPLRSLGRDDGHLAPSDHHVFRVATLPYCVTPVATLPHRVIPVATLPHRVIP